MDTGLALAVCLDCGSSGNIEEWAAEEEEEAGLGVFASSLRNSAPLLM